MSDIVRACRRTWRRLGVRRADVREMTAELQADLAAAASEGVPPTELVGHHPRGFALTWAVGLAATQGFSTDRAVVAGDLLVPAFTLAASVVAVRLQAVRRTSEAAGSRPAVLGETVA